MEDSCDVRRSAPVSHYYFRRELGGRELLPAIGVGVAVGLAAFYVARTFIARTPLDGGDRAARERTRAAGSRRGRGRGPGPASGPSSA